MKFEIKIKPSEWTTTMLLSRLEKDNAYCCVYIIVAASFFLDPGITRTLSICAGALIFLFNREEQKKIFKELKNRHEGI
jgi:hypothetical protein